MCSRSCALKLQRLPANDGDTGRTGARCRDAYRQPNIQYTGAEQNFRVPSGVKQVTVLARGGGTPSGDYGSSEPFFTGSSGGLVKSTIPVTPGERLAIFVGGHGTVGLDGAGGIGGFNGGGTGGVGIYGGSIAMVAAGVVAHRTSASMEVVSRTVVSR